MTEGRTAAKEKKGEPTQTGRKSADSRRADLRKAGDVLADHLEDIREETRKEIAALSQKTGGRVAALEQRMEETDALWTDFAAVEQKSIGAAEKAEQAERNVSSISQQVSAAEAAVEEIKEALVAEFQTTDNEGHPQKIEKRGKELIYHILDRLHKINSALGGAAREARTAKQGVAKLRQEFDEFKQEAEETIGALIGVLEKKGFIPKTEGGDS